MHLFFFQNDVPRTQSSMETSASVRKVTKGTDSRNVLKVKPEEIWKSRRRRNVTSRMRASMSAKMD